jgi:hypothetical protein
MNGTTNAKRLAATLKTRIPTLGTHFDTARKSLEDLCEWSGLERISLPLLRLASQEAKLEGFYLITKAEDKVRERPAHLLIIRKPPPWKGTKPPGDCWVIKHDRTGHILGSDASIYIFTKKSYAIGYAEMSKVEYRVETYTWDELKSLFEKASVLVEVDPVLSHDATLFSI